AGDAPMGAAVACADRQRLAVQPDRAALLRVIARYDIERRGLAATVRADQAVHLAVPDFEIEPVDRAYAAEAERHSFERERAGRRRSAQDARQEIGPRDDGAAAFERTAVLEIK